jgi:hypothetical protein
MQTNKHLGATFFVGWFLLSFYLITRLEYSSKFSTVLNFVVPLKKQSAAEVKNEEFSFLNPTWPEVPPSISKQCRVEFHDENMNLCHLIPWPNFGDELGPPIVKRILELHFGCSADDLPVFDLSLVYRGRGDLEPFKNRTGLALERGTCLTTVGSLWRMVNTGDHMWGTGIAHANTLQDRCKPRKTRLAQKVENVTVYSSRGPLSAGEVQQHCTYTSINGRTIEGAGDPGFLVPFIFPEYRSKKMKTYGEKRKRLVGEKKTCIVSHKHDEKKSAWKMVQKFERLSVGKSWINMTLDLQECDAVVSSSLHGIILSEALGIPSRRMRVNYKAGDFKFDDFYTSYRGSEPAYLNNLQAAFDGIVEPLSYQERDAYAKRILKTFPVHLFNVVKIK